MAKPLNPEQWAEHSSESRWRWLKHTGLRHTGLRHTGLRHTQGSDTQGSDTHRAQTHTHVHTILKAKPHSYLIPSLKRCQQRVFTVIDELRHTLRN